MRSVNINRLRQIRTVELHFTFEKELPMTARWHLKAPE